MSGPPSVTCDCHGQPWVFKGGGWRCAVKFQATQDRYEQSAARRASRQRYEDTPRRRERQTWRICVTADYRVAMPSMAHKLAAKELKRVALTRFKSRA